MCGLFLTLRSRTSVYFSLLGSVAVYSACDKQAKPLYASTAKTGKHTDPVWEVRSKTSFLNQKTRLSSHLAPDFDGNVREVKFSRRVRFFRFSILGEMAEGRS